MIARIVRVVGLTGMAAFIVWMARLAAHSKVPPPEGRWREVTESELQK